MTNLPLKILVNREGGAAARAGDGLAETLRRAFAAAGADSEISLLAPREMVSALASVAGREKRVVVAGGDGTIAIAALALTGSSTELAVLPLGTFNHFARDLGVPTDLGQAVALAAGGHAVGIDVGRVNEQLFVNNASIGLYPLMVRERDTIRRRRGWPKWLATLPAFTYTLTHLRQHRLRVDIGQGEEPVVTPLLFVGNNLYSLDRGRVGSRDTLQDAQLSVFAVAHRTRQALIWFATRALIGKADRLADFVLLGSTTGLTVRSAARSIEIALDGEVRRLRPPLHFTIEPAALRVVVPASR